jgi:hypothetical protein
MLMDKKGRPSRASVNLIFYPSSSNLPSQPLTHLGDANTDCSSSYESDGGQRGCLHEKGNEVGGIMTHSTQDNGRLCDRSKGGGTLNSTVALSGAIGNGLPGREGQMGMSVLRDSVGSMWSIGEEGDEGGFGSVRDHQIRKLGAIADEATSIQASHCVGQMKSLSKDGERAFAASPFEVQLR